MRLLLGTNQQGPARRRPQNSAPATLADCLRLVADDLDAGRPITRQWIEDGGLLDPEAVARYARLRAAADAEEELRGSPDRITLDVI
jgi:hypothetical protein